MNFFDVDSSCWENQQELIEEIAALACFSPVRDIAQLHAHYRVVMRNSNCTRDIARVTFDDVITFLGRRHQGKPWHVFCQGVLYSAFRLYQRNADQTKTGIREYNEFRSECRKLGIQEDWQNE